MTFKTHDNINYRAWEKMMLEYGDIEIKDPEDLAEAVRSGMNKLDFICLISLMIDRWGIPSTASMWGDALFNEEYGVIAKDAR